MRLEISEEVRRCLAEAVERGGVAYAPLPIVEPLEPLLRPSVWLLKLQIVDPLGANTTCPSAL